MVVGAAGLIGQNTLLVQPGTPGAHQDLASAVLAAVDGDTIEIVAPSGVSVSASTTITKSLTVVGNGAALNGTLVVSTPAGKEFTLRGCMLGSMPPYTYAGLDLQILGSAGRVTVADCRPSTPPTGSYSDFALGLITITDSTQVLVSNSGVQAPFSFTVQPPPVTVLRSNVVFERSEFRGSHAIYEFFRMPSFGLEVRDSACSFVDMTVRGGAQDPRGLAGAAAIFAVNSTLSIRGPGTRMLHGTPSFMAVYRSTSPLQIEPGLVATTEGTPTAVVTPLPSLLATRAVRGQLTSLTLRAPVGYLGAIAISQPGDRTPLSGAGDLWIDPVAPCFVVGRSGVQSAAPLTWNLAVPNDPLLFGLQFRAQAVTFDGSAWQLTPPSVLIVY